MVSVTFEKISDKYSTWFTILNCIGLSFSSGEIKDLAEKSAPKKLKPSRNRISSEDNVFFSTCSHRKNMI